ncbi:hypothetical protein [Rathayibacter sp. VKM Ac-2760]|uniref:hypothetical protein n=1 Tax=Rathayibacter sp. VKM Ac-2760 TaxID=2609253 RepID=UPI00131728D2|nr:hypothetical protein [Rathayibacter sp. VKM Ac-2760]QHC59846.1 hypothetical protein GSU72_15745 [Rathayibacter sp. VKM Ac-2760]
MSSSENDIEPTSGDSGITTGGAGTGTPAGLDEVGSPSPDGPDGVDAAGEEQNPPLPDWGPTDGVHGTDAETEDDTDASGAAGH